VSGSEVSHCTSENKGTWELDQNLTRCGALWLTFPILLTQRQFCKVFDSMHFKFSGERANHSEPVPQESRIDYLRIEMGSSEEVGKVEIRNCNLKNLRLIFECFSQISSSVIVSFSSKFRFGRFFSASFWASVDTCSRSSDSLLDTKLKTKWSVAASQK